MADTTTSLLSHPTSFSASEFVAAARAGLFGLLYVLHKRQPFDVAGLAFYAGQVVELLQILLFVVNPVSTPTRRRDPRIVCIHVICVHPDLQRSSFAWTSTILPLQTVSRYTTAAGYIDTLGSAAFYEALVLGAGVWAAVFLGISLWAIYEFAHARIPPMPALRALRTVATFSASVRACAPGSERGWQPNVLASPPHTHTHLADRLHPRLRGAGGDGQLRRCRRPA